MWIIPINQIIVGDCRKVMSGWPADSIDCCVTSPPYWGLRDYKIKPVIWLSELPVAPGHYVKGSDCEHEWSDEYKSERRPFSADIKNKSGSSMGKAKKEGGFVSQGQFCRKCGAWLGSLGLEPTIELYVRHITEVFREVRRILKPWGTLWLNIGDSYYGSNGTGGKPGDKQFTNIGSRRIVPDWNAGNLKPKDLCMIPARVALALQADGWYLRQDIIWHKPNPMPESCKDRCTKAHEYLFLLAKSAHYYYDQEAIKEPVAESTIGRGPVDFGGEKGRNYKPEKTDPNYRNGSEQWGRTFDYTLSCIGGRNRRSVWTIPTQPTPEAHFATYPQKLVEPCIMAGTSEKGNCPKCGRPRERILDIKTATSQRNAAGKHEGEYQRGRVTPRNSPEGDFHDLGTLECKTIGWTKCSCFENPESSIEHRASSIEYRPAVVLDPFIGSGTTGKVALKLGRDFIGIDISDRYVNDIASLSIKEAMTGVTVKEQRKGQKGLFV